MIHPRYLLRIGQIVRESTFMRFRHADSPALVYRKRGGLEAIAGTKNGRSASPHYMPSFRPQFLPTNSSTRLPRDALIRS